MFARTYDGRVSIEHRHAAARTDTKLTLHWKQLPRWLHSGAGHRHLPLLAGALALALVAHSAARFTWLMLPPPEGSEAAAPLRVAPAPAAGVADPAVLSREIAARHLLGMPPASSAPAANEPMPETQLNLQLRGVVASAEPGTAFAIVADPGGIENFYKVGDALPGGAELKEVHAQHIVLARNGRFEILRLPQQELVSPGPTAGLVGGIGETVQPSVAPDAGAAMRQLRDQFVQNPQVLANLLQGEPFNDGGQLVGYRVRPGRDAALFAKFGLQSGDVIVAINGISITDPQGRLELMRSIDSAEEVSVDLLRDGAPLSVIVPVGQ